MPLLRVFLGPTARFCIRSNSTMSGICGFLSTDAAIDVHGDLERMLQVQRQFDWQHVVAGLRLRVTPLVGASTRESCRIAPRGRRAFRMTTILLTMCMARRLTASRMSRSTPQRGDLRSATTHLA